ncbi:MAG TPA: CPBP family intramembrane metalloprotease [Phycisphaerae bacterium]|nr:CPBP family intramembrane metalloprotease [Phycisphaerae bacterium]
MHPSEATRTWACVILAMTLPFCGSLFYFVILKESKVAQGLYASVKVFTLLWPLIAIRWIGIRRRIRSSPPPNHHVRALPFGAISGVIIGASIITLFNLTPARDYVMQMAPRLRERLEFFGIHSVGVYMVWCVFLAGIHSLIEEYFWRWFVFETLLTLVARPIAYALAALSFALHHYVLCWQYVSPIGALIFGTGVGVGGLIWCWMVSWQRTLAGTWLSHAIVDAAIFVVGYQILFA